MDLSNRRHVPLGTISFAVRFTAWGLIGAFAPHFRDSLTPSETASLVALPFYWDPWRESLWAF
jgi:hypothetical protein